MLRRGALLRPRACEVVEGCYAEFVTVQRWDALVITASGEAGCIRAKQPLGRVVHDGGLPQSGKGSTAVSRGYTAEWSVTDDRLWLTAILDPHGEVWPAAMSHLFADRQSPILATWFSGRLVIELGEPIGWRWPWARSVASSIELVLRVERGVVIASRRRTPGLGTVFVRQLLLWLLPLVMLGTPIALLLAKGCGR
jgi:hypothetical protein